MRADIRIHDQLTYCLNLGKLSFKSDELLRKPLSYLEHLRIPVQRKYLSTTPIPGVVPDVEWAGILETKRVEIELCATFTTYVGIMLTFLPLLATTTPGTCHALGL